MICWHHWSPWTRLVENYDHSLWQFACCTKCNSVKKRQVRDWSVIKINSITAATANQALEEQKFCIDL